MSSWQFCGPEGGADHQETISAIVSRARLADARPTQARLGTRTSPSASPAMAFAVGGIYYKDPSADEAPHRPPGAKKIAAEGARLTRSLSSLQPAQLKGGKNMRPLSPARRLGRQNTITPAHFSRRDLAVHERPYSYVPICHVPISHIYAVSTSVLRVPPRGGKCPSTCT